MLVRRDQEVFDVVNAIIYRQTHPHRVKKRLTEVYNERTKGGCPKEAPCRWASEIKHAQIGNGDPHYPRLRTLKGEIDVPLEKGFYCCRCRPQQLSRLLMKQD